MHKFYKLREMLCDQLESYANEELTTTSLEYIDMLTHTIKNLDKILEGGEYGRNRSYNEYRTDYGMNDYRGDYGRRDSRGRYARGNDIVGELRNLMNEAPDERTRQYMQQMISKME